MRTVPDADDPIKLTPPPVRSPEARAWTSLAAATIDGYLTVYRKRPDTVRPIVVDGELVAFEATGWWDGFEVAARP